MSTPARASGDSLSASCRFSCSRASAQSPAAACRAPSARSASRLVGIAGQRLLEAGPGLLGRRSLIAIDPPRVQEGVDGGGLVGQHAGFPPAGGRISREIVLLQFEPRQRRQGARVLGRDRQRVGDRLARAVPSFEIVAAHGASSSSSGTITDGGAWRARAASICWPSVRAASWARPARRRLRTSIVPRLWIGECLGAELAQSGRRLVGVAEPLLEDAGAPPDH